MPIKQITATRPPDQHVVIAVADQVRLGQVPDTARYPLADLLVLIDQHSHRLPMAVVAAVDAVIAAFRTSSTDEVPPLMTVRVLDRSGAVAAVRTVTVPAVCIRCGGPRGRLFTVESTVHGITMPCDQWLNDCGHQDNAQAVLMEARRFADLVSDVETLTGGGR